MKHWTHLAVLALAGLLHAAPSLGQELDAYSSVTVGNSDYNPFHVYALASDSDTSNSTTIPATTMAEVAAPGASFSGLDGGGASQTMTFSASANSSAEFRIGSTPALRTFATGTLTNSFYNPTNPPYFDASVNPPVLDENGAPDMLSSYASASFTEILHWGGTATNYLAKFMFRIHGVVSGDPEGYAGLIVETGGETEVFWLPDDFTGTFIMDYVTRGFPAGLGYPQPITVTFIASFDPFTQRLPDGASVSGTYNFGATVTFEALDVINEDGSAVEDWSLSTDSGTTYRVITVFKSGFDDQ